MRKLVEVAREDARDAVRDRTLHYTVALFALIGTGLGYLFATQMSTQRGVDGAVFPALLVLPLVLLLPLGVLTYVYSSIVGKRVDGSLKLLLALPYTRRDVFAGTALGRLSLVVGPVLGYGVGAVATAAAMGASVALVPTFGVLGIGLFYGAVFVCLAVGISASTRSTTVAGGLAFGVFFLVFVVWPMLPTVFTFVANGFELGGPRPDWVEVIPRLNPQEAFRIAAARTFPELRSIGIPAADGSVTLEGWFAYLVLAAWGAVGAVPGYLRFEGADL